MDVKYHLPTIFTTKVYISIHACGCRSNSIFSQPLNDSHALPPRSAYRWNCETFKGEAVSRVPSLSPISVSSPTSSPTSSCVYVQINEERRLASDYFYEIAPSPSVNETVPTPTDTAPVFFLGPQDSLIYETQTTNLPYRCDICIAKLKSRDAKEWWQFWKKKSLWTFEGAYLLL